MTGVRRRRWKSQTIGVLEDPRLEACFGTPPLEGMLKGVRGGKGVTRDRLGAALPQPSPILTEFRVPMAAPAQLLQIALQDVSEEVAGTELHRVPAQRLADLRHRDPQQRPGVTLAHPAAWTPPQPFAATALQPCRLASAEPPIHCLGAPRRGNRPPPAPSDHLKASAARSAPA